MALNFQPFPLKESSDQRRQRDLELILQGLNALGTGIGQYQQQKGQMAMAQEAKRRQAMMDQLNLRKAVGEYGTSIFDPLPQEAQAFGVTPSTAAPLGVLGGTEQQRQPQAAQVPRVQTTPAVQPTPVTQPIPRPQPTPDILSPDYERQYGQRGVEKAIKREEFGMKRRELGLKEKKAEREGELSGLKAEQLRSQIAKINQDIEKLPRGKKAFESQLMNLKDLYQQLDDMGAAIDIEDRGIENLFRRVRASDAGQALGAALGTTEQSIRNKIAQARPLLINAIRQASQMGARGLDSEKELEFYLQAATDVKKDIQTNRRALNVLDKAYGLGLGLDPVLRRTQRNRKTGETRFQSSIDGGKTWE